MISLGVPFLDVRMCPNSKETVNLAGLLEFVGVDRRTVKVDIDPRNGIQAMM